MMLQRIITDNIAERITIKWDGDGERYGLVKEWKRLGRGREQVAIIILNPREMAALCLFYEEVNLK